MFQPPVVDKAGRGALCAEIDQLTKAIQRVQPAGSSPNREELGRLLARLDKVRGKFLKLYSYTPKTEEETHGTVY